MRARLALLAFLALSSGALAEDAPTPGDAAGAAAEAEAAVADPAPAKPLKPAEQRADQLDLLFAQLHRPGVNSAPVEEKIWLLWRSSDSPTAEVLLNQAATAIEDRAPAEALSILNRLIGANPDFAEAWNKRALLYFMMKKDDLALADIGHVLELEPRHFGALAGKGAILNRQKKYSAAREAYEEALAVNPTLDEVKAALKELDRVEQGI